MLLSMYLINVQFKFRKTVLLRNNSAQAIYVRNDILVYSEDK